MIYLDNAATTKTAPEVVEAMLPFFTEYYGNPSSVYSFASKSKEAVTRQREIIAGALGAKANEIYFTAGGTESDNWAIKAAAEAYESKGKHIITSKIEHHAVLHTCEYLEHRGFEVTYLNVDENGVVDLEELKQAIRPDTILISIMFANNEIGTIQPIEQIGRVCREAGVLFHTDAVQGFLKVPFTPRGLGADLVTISGHKVRAPKGIGALYIKKERISKWKPLLPGGGQEGGLRSGTEPTAQIAALAAACRAWGGEETIRHIADVKEYALERLRAQVEDLRVISAGDAPHICAVSLPGYPSEMLVRDMSDRGICVSSGSACHRGKPSHVFAALGLSKQELMGVLRVSFGPDSTRRDAEALADALAEIQKNRIAVR